MKTAIIADDHILTLMGIKDFAISLGYNIIETATNGIVALNHIITHEPDIAILDINMPGISGLEIAKKLKDQHLKTKIILLTMHKDSSIFEAAISYGISGYVLKEQAINELENCLNTINNAGIYYSEKIKYELTYGQRDTADINERLSLTEKKILKHISQKKTTRQISEILFISQKTVEAHRRNIIQKLELPKEKNTLLIWAIENMDKLGAY